MSNKDYYSILYFYLISFFDGYKHKIGIELYITNIKEIKYILLMRAHCIKVCIDS